MVNRQPLFQRPWSSALPVVTVAGFCVVGNFGVASEFGEYGKIGYAAELGNYSDSNSEVNRPNVFVGGLGILPFANFTFDDGRLEFHPTGRAQLGYDTNVFQQPRNEVDDWFGQVDVGLETRYYLSDTSLTVLDVDLFRRQYGSETSRNFTGGEVNFEWVRDTDLWVNRANVYYRRQDDPGFDNVRTVERQQFGVAGQVERRGNDWGWLLGADAERMDYLTDTPFVETDQRDRDTIAATGGVLRIFGEQSELSGRIRIWSTRYLESNSPFQDSISVRPSVNYLRPVGDRSVIDVSGGLDIRMFDDDFARDAAYDDQTVIWPYLDLRYRWSYREQSYLQFGGRSLAQDGYASNAVYVYGPLAEIRHKLPGRWGIFSSAQWIHREASGAPAGFSTAQSDTLTLVLRGLYRLRTGFVFRAGVTWRDFNADASDFDYQQAIFAIDANMAF